MIEFMCNIRTVQSSMTSAVGPLLIDIRERDGGYTNSQKEGMAIWKTFFAGMMHVKGDGQKKKKTPVCNAARPW